MIGFLRGTLLDRSDARLCVGVGSSDEGQIGYEVNAPGRLDYESILLGAGIALHVHTHVREDALDLYGFLSRDERELFLALLQVQNIGPKLGLGILSHVEPPDLLSMILRGESSSLTKIPGVGKKTAERLVLELRDPLAKKIESGRFASLASGAARPAGRAASPSGARTAGPALPRESIRDAHDALLGLGYREAQLSTLLERLAGAREEGVSAEALVKDALRELSQGGIR